MTASNPVKLSAQAIKNILYTPVFQAIEDGCPELGTFVFTNPHSQNIFLAIQIDSNGNVHCFFHNLPFAADMIVDGIQKDYGVDGLQPPLLPLLGNG